MSKFLVTFIWHAEHSSASEVDDNLKFLNLF